MDESMNLNGLGFNNNQAQSPNGSSNVAGTQPNSIPNNNAQPNIVEPQYVIPEPTIGQAATPTPVAPQPIVTPVIEQPTVQPVSPVVQPVVAPVNNPSVQPVVQQAPIEPAPVAQPNPINQVPVTATPAPETNQTVVNGPLGPTVIDPVDAGIKKEEPVAKAENILPQISETETPTAGASEASEGITPEESKQYMDDTVSDMFKELQESEMKKAQKDNLFASMDFGPLKKYLDDDDITDISYSNGGQLWLKSLSKGVYRSAEQNINDALMEKIAFQCSNVMGKTFNMAHPFLDSESAELRMNFVHDSIARNGIAAVFRKTPAKIRLEKEKLLEQKYVTLSIHDFLIKAVQGHCNILVCGETGSGKTELVKYLASHTAENEKIITIEDTLELHLDRIYPQRDIVAMKTNNIASYSDVLITCMRQNPKWILLSEVRSAEAVTAVRNSISSGHNILSTIHADKAESIPLRLYSLLETNIDVDQFIKTIHRYVQLGIFVRGRFDPKVGRFVREIAEVTEFYVDDDNNACHNVIYKKSIAGVETYNNLSAHLLEYLEGQGVDISTLKNIAPEKSSSDDMSTDEKIEEPAKEEKIESLNDEKEEKDKIKSELLEKLNNEDASDSSSSNAIQSILDNIKNQANAEA